MLLRSRCARVLPSCSACHYYHGVARAGPPTVQSARGCQATTKTYRKRGVRNVVFDRIVITKQGLQFTTDRLYHLDCIFQDALRYELQCNISTNMHRYINRSSLQAITAMYERFGLTGLKNDFSQPHHITPLSYVQGVRIKV